MCACVCVCVCVFALMNWSLHGVAVWGVIAMLHLILEVCHVLIVLEGGIQEDF